jgi:hypothetical protein
MYEAKQWREEVTYAAPMTFINGLSLFVGDFVTIATTDGSQEWCGKILEFFQLVRSWLN